MIRFAAPILTLCLLGAIGVDASARRHVPEGAEAYHRSVAEAVSLIPYRVGDWVGVDGDFHQDALRMLDANVSLNRTYRNVKTGESAILLVVQCADARSLLGHYPPICYPSQGWTPVLHRPETVAADGRSVLATQYEFMHETMGRPRRIEVLHFAVLPDGRTAPDLELLDRSARDSRTKFFGGASLQFLVDSSVPEARRQEIYRVLLDAASKWIDTVKAGMS